MHNTRLSCVTLKSVGLVLLCCVSLPMTAALADPLRLYVAPGGNDSWSGTLRQANDIGTDGPFGSLERARDDVRIRRAAGTIPAGGVEIELQAGIYELPARMALSTVSGWRRSG